MEFTPDPLFTDACTPFWDSNSRACASKSGLSAIRKQVNRRAAADLTFDGVERADALQSFGSGE
jgi:hypothetical protein